ncbi:hypothetical protein RchiOBHm_Chr6g0255261 [Rosa chinensis]|uniref:PB1-like domain-containing protein n=2 Tax=Rosa chinensis TaxID=74649 RepID=A0A2P6PLT9_ROSCH|nr:hypothetical protein RchiOBHm_Chr6g0255261 [Rosa chinensis]
MEIHHGGRFYRLGSGSRQYKGGEVVYVDRLDPDKISWPDLNIYAEDLGYREPPIMYWFLLPGSIQGEGWLPICEDKYVLDMLKFMPSNRILQIYIVGGGVRKKKEAELEDEGGGSPKEVDHQKYIGNGVENLEEVIDGDLAVTTLHGAKVSSKASGKRNKGGRPKNKKDVVTHLTNQFINVKASETIAGDNLVAENRKRPRMKQKACKMKKKSRPYETKFMGEKSFAEAEGIQEEPETSDSHVPAGGGNLMDFHVHMQSLQYSPRVID